MFSKYLLYCLEARARYFLLVFGGKEFNPVQNLVAAFVEGVFFQGKIQTDDSFSYSILETAL